MILPSLCLRASARRARAPFIAALLGAAWLPLLATAGCGGEATPPGPGPQSPAADLAASRSGSIAGGGDLESSAGESASGSFVGTSSGAPSGQASGAIGQAGSTGGTTGSAPSCDSVSRTQAKGESIVTLAKGQNETYCITTDGTNVYWSATGSVMKVPVGGGTYTQLATMGYSGGIATDGAYVYWSAPGLYKVGVNGGMAQELTPAFTNDNIILGPAGVVFGTGGEDELLGIPAAGGSVMMYTGGSGQNTYGLAADDGAVYWSNFDNPTQVLRTPLDGSPTVTLATGHAVFGMVSDASFVYWAEAQTGNVMRVPLSGGAATVVASGLGMPDQLAIDDANLYVTTGFQDLTSDGTIVKISKDGCAVTILASGQNQPSGIAVDGASVYWSTLGDGAIMKVTPK